MAFLVSGGTQTNIDVDTLRVKDKQIELARGEDSTILDDPQVDEAGIVVQSQWRQQRIYLEKCNKRLDNKRKFEHDRYCKTKI